MTTETSSKAPSHVAYIVRDREGGKGFFSRIGAAWPHKDGKGFNIQLDGQRHPVLAAARALASGARWGRRGQPWPSDGLLQHGLSGNRSLRELAPGLAVRP